MVIPNLDDIILEDEVVIDKVVDKVVDSAESAMFSYGPM